MTPLSYADLRRLEYMLMRYSTMVSAADLSEQVHTVLTAVSRRAGRAQMEEERECGWCRKLHHDKHPYLCAGCAGRSVSMVADEGSQS